MRIGLHPCGRHTEESYGYVVAKRFDEIWAICPVCLDPHQKYIHYKTLEEAEAELAIRKLFED